MGYNVRKLWNKLVELKLASRWERIMGIKKDTTVWKRNENIVSQYIDLGHVKNYYHYVMHYIVEL